MIWRVSIFQVGLAIIMLALSCILIARRRQEAREGKMQRPVSQGGSPLWIFVVLAVWAGASLVVAAVLLVTGSAVIDY